MPRGSLWCLLLLLSLASAKRVKRQFASYCFPRLQPPRNGYFSSQCSNVLGSSCTIACVPGTILIGESRLVCLPDTRTWNALLPVCVPNPVGSAGVAPQITNPMQVGGGICPGCQGSQGIVIGPPIGAYPGTVITPGGAAGTSMQIMCPALSPPANGIRSGNCDRASVGTACLFSCLPGYVLSGYPIITCGSAGQWNPQVPPMCMSQQPVYPPAYPGAAGPGGWAGGSAGNVVPGMMTTTSRPQVLMTTMVPAMVIPITTLSPPPSTCPPVQSPPNGLAQGVCVNAVPNSSCYFSCFGGFVLTGLPVLTCRVGGQWSSPPPTCRGIVPYRACSFGGIFSCRCRTCTG